jgi:hypothetical protein
MLDRIALNFAQLPREHYTEAILALPTSEETPNQLDNDYAELKLVFNKILETMRAGGRLHIGPASDTIKKEAILSGFLIHHENTKVQIPWKNLIIRPY